MFSKYGLACAGKLANIVHVVCGDLERPLLGITQTTFEFLANHAQSIVHSGAYVNHMKGKSCHCLERCEMTVVMRRFEYHRATNVDGTHEIMRLASAGPAAIPVHYLSTQAVFGNRLRVLASNGNNVTINEGTPRPTMAAMGRMRSTLAGYPQSKWVAEEVVLRAASRGIPVSIYRPGAPGLAE